LIGLVISNKNLLCGQWKKAEDKVILTKVGHVKFDQALQSILHNEKALNNILSSQIKRINDIIPLSGEEINISVDDDLLLHDVILNEKDLSREDHWDLIQWKTRKNHSKQNISTYCQTYLPEEPNLHLVSIPTHFVLNLKLTLSGFGSRPLWMGPISSSLLDWENVTNATWIHKSDKGLRFYSLYQQEFHFGDLGISGEKLFAKSATCNSEIAKILIGVKRSKNDEQTTILTGSLSPNIKKSLKRHHLLELKAFDGIEYDDNTENLPSFESIILSIMAKTKSYLYSMNFFDEPGITDFPLINKYHEVEQKQSEIQKKKSVPKISKLKAKGKKKKPKTEQNRVIIYITLLVLIFIGINFLKYRADNDMPIISFNFQEPYLNRANSKLGEKTIKKDVPIPQTLLQESQWKINTLNLLLKRTNLNDYAKLSMVSQSIAFEYRSEVEHGFSKIISGDLVENWEVKDSESSKLIRFYRFNMLFDTKISATESGLNPDDIITEIDFALSNYSIKYFDPLYQNQEMVERLLISVKSIEEIQIVSDIISQAGDRVLLHKFELLNASSQTQIKARYYLSFLNPRTGH
jgi:hypothetical protein